MEHNIILKNVTVRFMRDEGDVFAAQDVSLTLRAGQVTGIIGESGSGKSIIGMSILQLLPDNACITGEIEYDSENLLSKCEYDMIKLRGRHLGLVPQSPSESINPCIKIGHQVAESFILHWKSTKSSANQSAKNLLERFKLPDVDRCMQGYGFQLSGGMKQRVVSSFGVGGNPEWIIADEPTKGLDQKLEHQVREVLHEITKTTSMLLITHDLTLAADICDTVAVMHNGRVIEVGRVSILENPYHPYTKGLVASHPSKGMQAMPFSVDTLAENSCSIHNWCPHVTKPCKDQLPNLFSIEDRKVRCFCYDRNV